MVIYYISLFWDKCTPHTDREGDTAALAGLYPLTSVHCYIYIYEQCLFCLPTSALRGRYNIVCQHCSVMYAGMAAPHLPRLCVVCIFGESYYV